MLAAASPSESWHVGGAARLVERGLGGIAHRCSAHADRPRDDPEREGGVGPLVLGDAREHGARARLRAKEPRSPPRRAPRTTPRRSRHGPSRQRALRGWSRDLPTRQGRTAQVPWATRTGPPRARGRTRGARARSRRARPRGRPGPTTAAPRALRAPARAGRTTRSTRAPWRRPRATRHGAEPRAPPRAARRPLHRRDPSRREERAEGPSGSPRPREASHRVGQAPDRSRSSTPLFARKALSAGSFRCTTSAFRTARHTLPHRSAWCPERREAEPARWRTWVAADAPGCNTTSWPCTTTASAWGARGAREPARRTAWAWAWAWVWAWAWTRHSLRRG
jgi:hypothetical protein